VESTRPGSPPVPCSRGASWPARVVLPLPEGPDQQVAAQRCWVHHSILNGAAGQGQPVLRLTTLHRRQTTELRDRLP
jgi:hypothetical protein